MPPLFVAPEVAASLAQQEILFPYLERDASHDDVVDSIHGWIVRWDESQSLLRLRRICFASRLNFENAVLLLDLTARTEGVEGKACWIGDQLARWWRGARHPQRWRRPC